ncbi:hypothetical protein [Amycolatopsis sp. H20-H5]|uniref:hypothetical protein n=1 Tax=Amycolatopsis sp. H20-H5 TaxID=3046309 RepID=UPI002DB9D859|nr:hypothetical protein [Amycolatopsis sp. H20-H5]MEC3978742.1 hypothetical protein [Amycolatopsis sp. H20-H5]
MQSGDSASTGSDQGDALETRLRVVARWLASTWSEQQARSLADSWPARQAVVWDQLMRAATQKFVPQWEHDEDIDTLLATLAKDGTPKNDEILDDRISAAIEQTIHESRPVPIQQAGRGERAVGKGKEKEDHGESDDRPAGSPGGAAGSRTRRAALAALGDLRRALETGWANASDPWSVVWENLEQELRERPVVMMAAKQLLDEFAPSGPANLPAALAFLDKYTPVIADDVAALDDDDRVYFDHEAVAPQVEEVAAIRFGAAPGAASVSVRVPARKLVASGPVLTIYGFDGAAHPSRVRLVHYDSDGEGLDDSDGEKLDDADREKLDDARRGKPDEATAAEGVDTLEVPIRFSKCAYIDGDKLPLMSANVKFTYITQRFATRTGGRVSVRGTDLEMMRAFTVAVDNTFCSSIFKEVSLSFSVDMKASENGASFADVGWILRYTIRDEAGGKKDDSSGTIAIGGPQGKILDYTGATPGFFTIRR